MQSILIEAATLRLVRLPLAEAFRTSLGEDLWREFVVVEIQGEGLVGWGECVASQLPINLSAHWALYSYETNLTAWHILGDLLLPSLMGKRINQVEDIEWLFKRLRGHPMACAALELAVWDMLAQANETSLARMLNRGEPARQQVPVGVSVGIQSDFAMLLDVVNRYTKEGYRRVKCKIEPGWDAEPLTLVRLNFPDLTLTVDANGVYSLKDLPTFEALDKLNLALIEQPLNPDNILDHRTLQSRLESKVCLDESIYTLESAKTAIALSACRAINIKPGRVGGLLVARRIHDLCEAENILVWCGGMLESGIGRAANLALSTLPGFSFPGDISASSRYYTRDIAQPSFELNPNGTINVPTGPGLGIEIDIEYLDSMVAEKRFLN